MSNETRIHNAFPSTSHGSYKIFKPLISTLTVADLYNLILILRLLTILRYDYENKFKQYKKMQV